MATSGSTTVHATYTSSGSAVCDDLVFSWSRTSYSIENNTSTISWTLELVSYTYGTIYSSVYKPWSVTINGTNYSGTANVGIGENTSKTLASGTTTIKHNDDGTKTFMYSFSQAFDIAFNVWVGTVSGGGSGTLDTIPRASSLSVSDGTLGTEQTITADKKVSTFTHTLTWKSGDYSGTICTKSSDTSWSFTPQMELANGAPNAPSVYCEFKLSTYSGDTLIGTVTKSVKMAIPASVKPSCSIVVSDPTGYAAIFGGYVQKNSKVKTIVTPTSAYGSPIVSYSVKVDGNTLTEAESTSPIIQTSGSLVVTATVMDGRGRTGSSSQTINVLPYEDPKISLFKVKRCDADGTENERGVYCQATYSHKITSLGNENAKTVTLKYKKTSEDTWTDVTLTSEYTSTEATTIFPADDGSAYDVSLVVADTFTTTSNTTKLSIGYTLIHYTKSGKGVTFGSVATEDGFNVHMESKFTENVLIEDNLNGTSPNLFNPYPFLAHSGCKSVSDDGTITLVEKKTFAASAPFSEVFPSLKVGKTYRLRAYRMSGTHQMNNIIYFTGSSSSASYGGTFAVTEAMLAGRVNLYNASYSADLETVTDLDIRFAVYGDTNKTEYEPYCKRIGIRYGQNEMYMCVPGDIDSPACLYAPKSNASSVGTPLYPFDSIYANNVYVNGRQYGVNKVLWSGAWYMNASQTATLSEAVSAQPNGIVLVFSRYQDGVEQNWGFESFFVPKHLVATHAAQGSYFSSNQLGRPWCKYIYISDTELRGNADNTISGTFDGRDLFNDYCVLRYVIGV